MALLPGSRRQEIAYNLPPIAGALRLLRQQRPDLQAALAVAPGIDPSQFDASLGELRVARVSGQAHALLGAATAGIVASGTATVEVALLDLPSVVVYRLSPLSYVLGRPFVHVPHYAMANLIAERRVLTELIQGEFRPDTVAAEVGRLLDDPERRAALKNGPRRGPTEARRTGCLGTGRRGRSALPGLEIQKNLDRKRGCM